MLAHPERLAGRVAGAVAIVAVLAAGWARAHDRVAARQRPNVLFIAVDDLRPTIGAYGDPYAKTPNLDRLARSGATFLSAYAQQALCNPSRASLLTGLRPDSIRVWDLETDFRTNVPDVVTLPQHFMRHGYRTVQIGKIYHNTIPDSRSWHQEIHLPGFPYDPDAVYHGRENLAIQEAQKARLIAEGQEDRAIDRFGMWYLKAKATESLDLPDNAYYDGAQTDRALEELAALKGRQPFFFAIGYYRPHLPFNAPRKYWDLYDPDSIALAPNPDMPRDAPPAAGSNLAELRRYADFATAPEPWEGRLSEADARRLKHGYYASVSYVDALVGRLLDRLDQLGLAKNTIVVLWGDHGYKLGEMNGWGKMSNYLIDTHSPLIIRAPGAAPAGLRLEQLVELVDVYPTLSELAGLPVPDRLQGTSAVPLLQRPDRPWKRAVFSQFLRRGRWLGPDGIETMGYSMRTERFHYVAWMNWATRRITARELYDLEGDPAETVNLAPGPEFRSVLEELEAQRRDGWRAAAPRAQPSTADPGAARFITVPSGLVAITHVQLIDGSGTPARPDHTVILRGDRIEAVGPSADLAVPAGARVLDLGGHTVLPGLVGLHEHTYFGGVDRFTDMRVSAPLLYLALGVTTAMTAGSRSPEFELELKRRVDQGRIPGPRFHVSGPYLDIAAGGPVNRVAVTTPDEARRVVAEWAGRGATWFKFLGGASREVMGAAIAEAHARGLRVTGHLCSVTFSEAAALGMDALQHGFITNSDYVAGKRPDQCPAGNMKVQADVDLGSPAARESIRRIVAGGSAVVSTLGVYETFDPERARLHPGAMAMLAPATRREVEENHARIAERGFTVPTRLLKKMMEWERMFVAAGGLLGAGSDPWGTGYLPGFGNLRNYELLVEAGFNAEQAVQIMTLNGARILGVDRETGSIAPGKLADVVVVRGDPVRAPGEIYRVVTVFKGGAGYDSGRLRAAARGKVGVE